MGTPVTMSAGTGDDSVYTIANDKSIASVSGAVCSVTANVKIAYSVTVEKPNN